MADKKAKVFLSVDKIYGISFELKHFHAVERISDLFEYTLIMTTEKNDINFDDVLGKDVTVNIAFGSDKRTFNGIIGEFTQDDTPFEETKFYNVYKAKVFPNLWLLNFSGQCRIFQNESTIDIIKKVLEEHKIKISDHVSSAGKAKREYCVQYNETDLAFISRLMEQEGIYYFFEQKRDSHTLVLADTSEGHTDCPNAKSVDFHDSGAPVPFINTVSSCYISQRVVPKNSTFRSYNYLKPKTDLKVNKTGPEDAKGGELVRYEQIYTEKERGDDFVKVKIESEDAFQKMVKGVSSVPFFIAGYKYSLKKHPRKDANKSYVLYEVIHDVKIVPEEDYRTIYRNTYRAFPDSTSFKPIQKTPWPRIFGTQTAKVTGKKDEEIYTEEYGRIKVKFHWDPSDKNDESTSCWIRVATLWSGKSWGTLFTPRIDQEVVVSFTDGDPDKPIIIGSVYNGEHKPPYLPSDPTKSTIKTHSSKAEGSEAGFNELRFEDKKEKEEIYIHAQKDFNIDVQNDQNITVIGGNRDIKLQAKSEKEEDSGGKKSNDTLTMENGDKTLEIKKGDYKITLKKGKISVTCDDGDLDFDIKGNISFKCKGEFKVDAQKEITIKSEKNIDINSSKNVTIKASSNATLQAESNLTLKGEGKAKFTSGGDMNVQSGGDVTLTSGGDISVTSGGDITETVGGAYELTGGGDVTITAGGAAEVTAGGDGTLTAGGALEITAAGAVTVTAAASVAITGVTILLNG